ncbi:EXS family-domain-containing protein, partial [Gongronella butleri]
MLCPFNLFYFDARRWLGVALARIFLSYCFPVEFRDFFIADELNSLAYSFWTLSYFFCAYSWHWTGLDDHCRFSTSWLTPLLASLPPWWRLLQCLRRYKDSNERVHLINGAKYTSSILSTLVSGLKRINGGAWTVYLSIFMSIISSVYTATWDVKMDWGLVQPQSQYLFLRDELVFHRWVYYLAVPINTFLRFSWALSFAGLNVHPDILTFVLAVMEGMRRIQWNVFRLENEHLNNCGQCRAIKEIPLPF